MELVRGRPFDGLRASDWPILEGFPPPSRRQSSTSLPGWHPIASLQGTRPVQNGHPEGLWVSPYDERLYRMLLRAADLAGNPAGVEAVMSELLHLVADDVEPFDSVHPETTDLYRSLTRRRSFAPFPR